MAAGMRHKLRVQVRQNFQWTDVDGVTVTPTYPYSNQAGAYTTYTFESSEHLGRWSTHYRPARRDFVFHLDRSTRDLLPCGRNLQVTLDQNRRCGPPATATQSRSEGDKKSFLNVATYIDEIPFVSPTHNNKPQPAMLECAPYHVHRSREACRSHDSRVRVLNRVCRLVREIRPGRNQAHTQGSECLIAPIGRVRVSAKSGCQHSREK